MNNMRYIIGTLMLCWTGYFGGNIIVAAILMGVAWGYIDYKREY